MHRKSGLFVFPYIAAEPFAYTLRRLYATTACPSPYENWPSTRLFQARAIAGAILSAAQRSNSAGLMQSASSGI